MISRLEWRLKQFVDRDTEMARFCEFLNGEEKLVTAVFGPAGIGKTSLKDRMIHECSLRELAKVEIVYTDDDFPDYMTIMRATRDNLGAKHFSEFTDLINYYTDQNYKLQIEVKGNVTVAQGLQVTDGAQVGDIAGVVIRDSMFTFPRTDLDVSEAERRATLTQRFLASLAAVAKQHKRIVIMIDGAEKMSKAPGTARWIWDVVIPGLAEGKVTNVRFVVFGREEPQLDGWMQQIVDLAPLAPLGVPDIELYMEKRGVPAPYILGAGQLVFANSKGNPLEVSNQVDLLLAMIKQRSAA